MAAVTICSDYGSFKNKVSHCLHCFPIYLPWSDGTRSDDHYIYYCGQESFRRNGVAIMVNKSPSSQSYGFSSSHVWMWELDYKESWVLKNWWFWIVVLEKILESPLDCKEILPVHPKGNQSWIFIERTNAEAEAPILWSTDGKSWLIGKDSDARRDWRQEEKGMTEDEMAGWHHWLNGRESEWTPRPGVLQFMGSQRVGHDCATELNWTEYSIVYIYHNFFIHSSLMDI